jgi:integrase
VTMAKRSDDGLTKLGPGRWRARITVRDPATGKKALDTTRTFSADTKLEAMAKRKALRDELVGSGDEWTVNEALDAWMPTLRSGTLHARKTHAKRIRAAFGTLKLSLVPAPDVQRWLARLPGCDDTANYHRATLQALYKFARERGRLRGANPIALTQARTTAKTSAELLAELEAPAPTKALLGDAAAKFFAALEQLHPALVPVARAQLLLGCRWSEVTTLRWSDINWESGLVTIRRGQSRNAELGPPKGKKKRVAGLGPEGLAFFRGHRAEMERLGWPGSDEWAFAKPPMGKPRKHDLWGYETCRRYVKDALRAAGLDVDAVTHTLRHTHVTLARALESDAALRASVGHADKSMTELYTDDSHRAAVAQSFAGRLEGLLPGVQSGGADVVQISKSFKKTR